jgi:putative pyruvate formate lyase activating enzyme
MDGYFLKNFTRRDFLGNTAKLCFLAGMSAIFLNCPETESSSKETKVELEKPGKTGPDFAPAYLRLHKTGELAERAAKLWAMMESCRLCPRKCEENRLAGKSGTCRAPGVRLIVSGYQAHFGEERPLVGTGGSGTVFFSHCNLRCVFCQNWTISHLGRGSETNINGLAAMMLRLQENGCHNINLVTPTHYSPHIFKALEVAAGKGLRLPIAYNSSGWERLEILALLDGVVDIYLPDFKYWDGALAAKFSAGAESYPEDTRKAILEMNRQVGVAKLTRQGLIQRGLMIRHLVMPNNTGGSEKIMEWIAENLPKDTYVNIMAQYAPAHRAYDYPELSRRITGREYRQVVQRAKDLGLKNLDVQGSLWL